MARIICLSLASLALAAFSHANSFTSPMRRDINLLLPPAMESLKSAQPRTLAMQMPIDHFTANDTRTFPSRYYINETFYRPGGPVIVYDVGEGTADDNVVQAVLMEAYGPSNVMQLAAAHNGLAVVIEHRFYGNSTPFPMNLTTGIAPAGYDAYKYHTVEQALEDVVYFAKNFKPAGLEQYWTQLQPSQTPWLFIGGSYPGDRAAWIRIRNPEIIYASWASSAPVQTNLDMPTYFTSVQSDMTANCSADLAAASRYVTRVLANGTSQQKAIITTLVLLASQPQYMATIQGLNDQQILALAQDADFSDFDVALTLASFVDMNYQSIGFDAGLLPVCNLVEQFNAEMIDSSTLWRLIKTNFNNAYNKPATAVGLAASSGTTGEQLSFLAVTSAIYVRAKEQLDQDLPKDIYGRQNEQSWAYQTCTELGYFQVASPGSPHNLLSPIINETNWLEYNCHKPFPWLKDSTPSTKVLIDRYGGWHMNPSQVMFTDGLKDPWHTLSVQSTSSEIGAPSRKTTQTVPECGKGASGSDVFGLVFPDSYHVWDFQGSKQSVQDGTALFDKALNKWLPCFQKQTSSTTSATSSKPTASATGSSTPSQSSSADGRAPHRSAQLGGILAILAALTLL